jgi:hypothetical protein
MKAMCLTVYQPDNDSVSWYESSASATLQKSNIILVAHSSGETDFCIAVSDLNSAMTSLWVDKKFLPQRYSSVYHL